MNPRDLRRREYVIRSYFNFTVGIFSGAAAVYVLWGLKSAAWVVLLGAASSYSSAVVDARKAGKLGDLKE